VWHGQEGKKGKETEKRWKAPQGAFPLCQDRAVLQRKRKEKKKKKKKVALCRVPDFKVEKEEQNGGLCCNLELCSGAN